MAWSDILGQPFAVQLLTGHLKRGRRPSAYLFVGPPGVGKRLAAFELGKAVNCEQDGANACGRCGQCVRITRQTHPDLHWLVPQGALDAIRIDEVRHVLGRLALRPFMARFQIAIIDGADRLTEEAANSLLKALEEPTSRTVFILTAVQASGCLPTIVSRCQLVRFQRLPDAVIETILAGLHPYEPQALRFASRLSQGSVLRALALADQWASHHAQSSQFGSDDPMRWFSWPVPTDRSEAAQWLSGGIEWLRDVAVASVADASQIHHQDSAPAICRQAGQWNRERCMDAAFRFVTLWESLEQLVSPRMVGALLREEWLDLLEG